MLRALIENLQVPDAIEPARGWRSWRVDDGRFVSPDQGTAWDEHAHLAWDMRCGCGENTPEAIERRRQAQARQQVRANAPHAFKSWTRGQATRPRAAAAYVQGGQAFWGTAARTFNPVTYSAVQWGLAGHEELAPEAERKNETCYCGINAFTHRHQIARSRYVLPWIRGRQARAVGTVALWGHARQYELGWRAEHARIQQVWALRWRDRAAVRHAAGLANISYMGKAPRLRWTSLAFALWVRTHLAAPSGFRSFSWAQTLLPTWAIIASAMTAAWMLAAGRGAIFSFVVAALFATFICVWTAMFVESDRKLRTRQREASDAQREADKQALSEIDAILAEHGYDFMGLD